MNVFTDWGYFGLFAGCFLAATIFPFSSDALFVASLGLGGESYWVLFWATLGNWLGGLTTYWVGYIGKWQWMEKWFRVKEETLRKQKAKIDKYGSLLAFLVWIPFIGDIFAVALGFYKVNFYQSAAFMLIGKFLRFAGLMFIFTHFKEWLQYII